MDWLNTLATQFNVIWAAPLPFLLAWSILTYGAYRLARHHFCERLANMETRISLRDEQIASLKEAQRSDTPSPAPGVAVAASPSILTPVRPTTHSVKIGSGQKDVLDGSITPQSLMALCKDKTTIQAQRLTAGYIGKWIGFEGKLANVSELSNGAHYAAIDISGETGFETLWVEFAGAVPPLEAMEKGAPVRVVARIEKIKELSMDLESGELQS